MNVVDVFVAGAGISGLASAFFAKRKGLSVLLCEHSASLGGKISTVLENGFRYELGPNTLQVKDQPLMQLIEELSLQSQVVFANASAKTRFIVRDGALMALPRSPWEAITTPILSIKAKLRLLREPFIPASTESEETIYDFFARRFGSEIADYPLTAFVRGIYAGDPHRLLMEAAFPKVKALESEKGSVFLGVLSKFGSRSKSPTRPRSPIFSFAQGMQALPQALSQALQGQIWTSSTVLAVTPSHGSFQVQVSTPQGLRNVTASQVVLTLSPKSSAQVVAPLSAELSAHLQALHYPPLAIIVTGFYKQHVPHDLKGFGYLCPEIERRFMLGSLWSSSLFSERAPADSVLLTAMVGGSSEAHKVGLSDQELLDGILLDYRDLLGIQAKPHFMRVSRWQESIPQYDSVQRQVVLAIEQFEKRFPGLHVSGNFRGGVSVGACIAQAQALVKRIPNPRAALDSLCENG